MVNWYYVVGAERVGPVSQEMLQNLFDNDDINLDTYVWKKGFENWERYKNVVELSERNLENSLEKRAFPTMTEDSMREVEVETTSDELAQEEVVTLNFSWDDIDDKREIFYLKVGRDRHQRGAEAVFGPYSLEELFEAYKEKRINEETCLFSPGMSSWVKIFNTPINKNYNAKTNVSIELDEAPLFFVMNVDGDMVISVVKDANAAEAELLSEKRVAALVNQKLQCDLYHGNEMKFKDIELKVRSYNLHEQTLSCSFNHISTDAVKFLLQN